MFLLPLLRLARGVLVDNLEVRTPDGCRLSTLNANDYYNVIGPMISAYVKAASARERLLPQEETAIARLVEQARRGRPSRADESEHVEPGSHPEALDGASESAAADLPEAGSESAAGNLPEGGSQPDASDPLAWILEIELTESGANQGEWEVARQWLYEFCEGVLEGQIIFAPVVGAPGERMLLSYSFTARHRPNAYGIRDRIRYWMGLRPHEHRLTLTEHKWAQSYHLEFWASADQYVYECDVTAVEGPHGGPAGSSISFAPTGTRGADYGHIYVRETGRHEYREREDLFIQVDCREKPPGMLGTIAIIAAAQTLLIWIVGWHHDLFFPRVGAKPGRSSLTPTSRRYFSHCRA